MTRLPMLRSKISRTKKKLSDLSWPTTIIFISIMGLWGILTFSFRSVAHLKSYGIVDVEIPLISVPLNDPTFHTFEEKTPTTIDAHTPVVAITKSSLLFGEAMAFTEDMLKSRNKFSIDHEDGAPQLGKLIKIMKTWMTKEHGSSPRENEIVVILSVDEIPVPIVIQMIASLKDSKLFKHVVLASGIL